MASCADDAKNREKKCKEYRDDGYEDCKEYRDDGYNACDRWDANCCSWIPCRWACKLITWICVAWVWISNVVCVAWFWVSNLVCVVWAFTVAAICIGVDALVTGIGAVLETAESVLGWVLSAIGWVVEFVLSIPVIGRALGWILAIGQTIFWAGVGIADTIAGFIGIRPEKKLRVCTIILSDENGRPIVPETTVVPWLQRAVD